MKLPKAIEDFMKEFAPEILEQVEKEEADKPPVIQTAPATLTAPAPKPVEVDNVKAELQTNLANMNSSIDKMLVTLKEMESGKFESEFNRVAMVFLQKAKDNLKKHSTWMTDK